LIINLYGAKATTKQHKNQEKTLLSTSYLRSPIFISVVAGNVVSQFQALIKTPFMAPFWESLRMILGTLTVMTCLILTLKVLLICKISV